MKKVCLLASLMLVMMIGCVWAEGDPGAYLKNVSHYKQSTVRIAGEKIVYFDPFMFTGEPHDADIIMITHTHGDHFSIPDLMKVLKSDTTVLITADGVDKAKEAGIKNVVAVLPNQVYDVKGLKIQTVPAYNTNKGFHPQSNNWVGYLCKLNQVTYYMAGDTDLIPEMKNINADVAFLPVGGTYTMTAQEAAAAANLIKPAVAVPIHFADVVGTVQDAKDFVALLEKPVQGVILKK